MNPEGQPKSGKYQSQVMNFLNRQILAIQDRTTKTWRQLKVTLIWGAQVVLYPIYAIVQASRFALHQFTGKTSSAQIPNAPPAADSAIVRILSDLVGLSNLEGFNLEGSNLEDATPTVTSPALSGLTAQAQLPARRHNAPALDQLTVAENFDLQALQIVGIATDLQSRQLVLVTQTWATIALTAQQHHQLTQRISWELAQYGYDYRTFLKRQVNPALSSVSSQAWPIVRAFWGLMHWVQQSEMALELDWFGEQSLLNPEFTSSGFISPGFTAPGSTNKSQGLPGFTPRASLGGSYGLTSIGGLSQTPHDSRIARAIAYFSKRIKLLGAAGAAGAAIIQAMPAGAQMRFNAPHSNPQSNLSTAILVDHVLAMQAQNTLGGDRSSDLTPPVRHRQRIRGQKLIGQTLNDQRRIGPTLNDQKLSWRGIFDLESTDRWIETDAQPMGYVKHPLERFLRWIDGCISWIETKIIAIWKTLR